MDVTIATNRLVLRPQVESDIGALMSGLNDYEVVRYLTVVPFPYILDDAQSWIARQKLPAPGHATFAIDLSGEGMIGAVSLDNELGYWLARRFHGRGIMTEASEALLDWHFAALPDDLVPCGAQVGNAASLNVQNKLGFVDTGTTRMRFVRSQNREIEHVETTLSLHDFQVARQRLRRR